MDLEQLDNNSVLVVTKEFLMENFKPLVVLVTSLITAHSPVHSFLDYNWHEWLPFLEVLKTVFSIGAILVSTLVLVLNYFKKMKK